MLPGTGVGGAGVHWNGQTWRFHPRDFTIRTSTIDRYGAAAIPANMTIQDWGITYDELEPYYDKFEYMAGIAGKAGNLKGQQIAGGNVFEGPRSREFPVKPPADTPVMALFKQATKNLGYHPFTGPDGEPAEHLQEPGRDRARPVHLLRLLRALRLRGRREGGSDRHGAARRAQDGQVQGASTTRTHSRSRTTARTRRASSTTTAWAAIQEQPADIIVLGAFVFNNVRLLLISKLGTPYDPVYRHRASSGATTPTRPAAAERAAGSRTKSSSATWAAGALSAAIDDFNADNFDHSGLGFLGGGSITVGQSGARPIQSLSVPPGTPAFGSEWKAAIKKYYRPRRSASASRASRRRTRQHYLDLDPTYRDKFGNPLLRITFDWEPNERAMIAYAGNKTLGIMQEMIPNGQVAKGGPLSPTAPGIISGGPGSLPAHFDTTSYQSTHNTGGAIMGADPETSVVNNYLQMWDAQNVFVVGACNFPQNAGFNPTGTVGALAYRAAEGILKYHKSGGQSRMSGLDLEPYDGRWVAVRDGEVVVAAADDEEARSAPRGRRGDRPRVPDRRAAVGLLPDQRLAGGTGPQARCVCGPVSRRGSAG